MRVVFWCACWFGIVVTEEPGCGAIHEGSEDLYPFDAFLVVGWSHIDIVVGVDEGMEVDRIEVSLGEG